MTKNTSFSPYQKFVVAVLAFLQFTIVLDFMILSPLGAILMPEMHITPGQFGLVVSAYAFSAGTSGFLAAGFADRFDRKKFLLFFYMGFLLGTLFCAAAPSYHFLLAARMITGLFGGVIGSISFAIITDIFPFEMRGRVMGFVQTAFAGSQVLGIPVGLYLANNWGWHMPFFMIVAVSSLVGIVIWIFLKPVNSHLKLQSDNKALHHLWVCISTPDYLQAFATTALLTTGGFMLMPFGSAFSVHNNGIPITQIPIVYMSTGLATMFIGPLIGRISDKIGKFKTFLFGTCLSIVMVIIYTHLGITPLHLVILVSVVMFVGIFSRMIPSQALISAIPQAANRGSFMSVNSSIQQISGGIASIIAGLIVVERTDGSIGNFPIVGYVYVATSVFTLTMMYFIHRKISEKLA